MIIQYASDLHYEFLRNRLFLEKQPLRPVGDILILAGDIIPLHQLNKHSDFIDFLSNNWSTVLWIPGNHEFYQSDFAPYDAPFNVEIRENIHLVSEQSIIIDQVQFICATLWSHISVANAALINQSLSDFHTISYKDSGFQTKHFNATHLRHKEFIEKQLRSRTQDIRSQIVVTHHVPVLKNYPAEYAGSPINDAFVADLEQFIIDEKPDYWIYGHHHRNIQTFKVNHTHLLTNQLGYVHQREHQLFKASCTITV